MFTSRKGERDGVTVPVPGTNTAHVPAPPPQTQRAPVRSGDRSSTSMIGADLVIVGNLISNGLVQIDGEIQGDVHGTHIVVGESARITGGIVSEEVVVRGTVMGSIRGRKVMLQSDSKVEGDIYHKTLAIEQGAFFEGKSRRSDDPLAGVERPELPPAA
ncbi:bactofilin family protein [Leptospira interrogans]